MVVPDTAAPLTAWRAWLVLKTRDGWRLRSRLLSSRYHLEEAIEQHPAEIWHPGEAFQAHCRSLRLSPEGTEDHPAPDPHCTCGIYALESRGRLRSYVLGQTLLMQVIFDRLDFDPTLAQMAIGTVALWGRVEEGERGYRAEFAYPKELYLPLMPGDSLEEVERIAVGLADAYQLPVSVSPELVVARSSAERAILRDALWNLVLLLTKSEGYSLTVELDRHGQLLSEQLPVYDKVSPRVLCDHLKELALFDLEAETPQQGIIGGSIIPRPLSLRSEHTTEGHERLTFFAAR